MRYLPQAPIGNCWVVPKFKPKPGSKVCAALVSFPSISTEQVCILVGPREVVLYGYEPKFGAKSRPWTLRISPEDQEAVTK